ncbi:uncharacterized protein YkwD [Scopulibacillus darangshiensis]|uniref:Uncharacterized protein YkwD n=2 Tax=Scopulibacillus darangshiensis TaxID=442528 RepID=A0A4R2P6L8_9BACL|nr:uncharacterized protein YkwD [Scopulibacillus darangshiensis]
MDPKKTDNLADGPTQTGFKVPDKGLYTFMGKTKNDIQKKFGKPERIDPTPYGYKWWVYGIGTESYVQIGLDNDSGKVTTIYALGKELMTEPFGIGKHSDDIYKKVPLSDTVSFKYDQAKIEFEFTEDDLMVRPLIKFGDSWVQLNFDHITDRLMGVRYMTPEVLIKQKPYTLTFRGKIPEEPKLSDEKWQAIDQATAKEIFDMTNILRHRYNVNQLDWSASASGAAFQHSKEMSVKNYFSHDSKWQGDLSKRLEKAGVSFEAAGENIAAQYTDASAVVLGWLNSEEHRKNMLSDMFTELGVGVYHDYYTQDFVHPFQQ